jgi:hypothetical protein
LKDSEKWKPFVEILEKLDVQIIISNICAIFFTKNRISQNMDYLKLNKAFFHTDLKANEK